MRKGIKRFLSSMLISLMLFSGIALAQSSPMFKKSGTVLRPLKDTWSIFTTALEANDVTINNALNLTGSVGLSGITSAGPITIDYDGDALILKDGSSNTYIRFDNDYADPLGLASTGGLIINDAAGTDRIVLERADVGGGNYANALIMQKSATDFGSVVAMVDDSGNDMITIGTWQGIYVGSSANDYALGVDYIWDTLTDGEIYKFNGATGNLTIGGNIESNGTGTNTFNGDIQIIGSSSTSSALSDGDMEAVGTASWGGHAGAVLTKAADERTGGAGAQSLQVTQPVTPADVAATQSVLTASTEYLISGWYKSDGNCTPFSQIDFSGGPGWSGTTATSWTAFNFTATSTSTVIMFGSSSCATGEWVRYDDVTAVSTAGIPVVLLDKDGNSNFRKDKNSESGIAIINTDDTSGSATVLRFNNGTNIGAIYGYRQSDGGFPSALFMQHENASGFLALGSATQDIVFTSGSGGGIAERGRWTGGDFSVADGQLTLNSTSASADLIEGSYTGDSVWGLDIANGSTTRVALGKVDSSAGTFYFKRDEVSADTNGAVASIRNMNAGDDQDTLTLNNVAGNLHITTVDTNEDLNVGTNGTGAININADMNVGVLKGFLNGGAMIIWDMPVDGTPAAGEEMSGSIMIDSNVILKSYCEVDGSGGVQNCEVRMPEGLDITKSGTSDSITIDHDIDNTTASNKYGINLDYDRIGTVASGTDNNYGIYSTPTVTGASGGTINTYGYYGVATGNTGGDSTTYGAWLQSIGADDEVGIEVWSRATTALTNTINDTIGRFVSNGSSRLAINAGTGSTSILDMGNVSDQDEAAIIYDNSTNVMSFRTGGSTNGPAIGAGGSFTTSSARFLKVTIVSAATYDLLTTDDILHVTYTATGAVTSLTLPTAQCNGAEDDGRIITIKDAGGNAGTNNITVDVQGGETIDGAATITIDTDYLSYDLYCESNNWFIY